MNIKKTREGLVVSDMIDGYRFARLYIGYTRKEAIALFLEETKLEEKGGLK